MVYPADWNEFEDGEGSFLFYNPNEWTGNFRISAYKGDTAYGRESVKQELKEKFGYNVYLPYWTNFEKMKKHFIANNESIELY